MGKRLFEIDVGNDDRARRIQRKYGSRVQVVWFHDSDWFTLASLDPKLTVEDLVAEFELIPRDKYIARCSKAIDRARAEAISTAPRKLVPR